MIVLHTIVYPIIEYSIHYIVHKTENVFHREHHNCVTEGKMYLLTREYWCITCIISSMILGFYGICSMFVRYWIFHQYIHNNWDDDCNIYVRHHKIHHKKSRYNYGVSSMWMDKLMGTYKT